jgi:hypothetical protein
MTRTWYRRFVLAAAVAGALAVLWLLFWPVANWLGGDALTKLEPKDQLAALGTIRGQLGAVLSAAFVGGGLYYTGRKFFLDRDKQFTDRFNSAIDHLGSADETVRAGGVRALDRILGDSPTDRNRVLESITGFLRHHTQAARTADRDDISAAIATLRNRGTAARRAPEESPLDLRGLRAPQANLRGLRLTRADLSGQAELTGASLIDTDLSEARLPHANLINADLTRANLSGSYLPAARLSRADLSAADLRGADFTDTDFAGAVLLDADLRGTDLSRTRGLTGEQVAQAHTDHHTVLPPHLTDPPETGRRGTA